ncbi:MAG: hypothetical protein ACLTYW_05390 [Collinsella sp.]
MVHQPAHHGQVQHAHPAKGTVFSAVSNMTGLPQSTVAIILGIVLAVAIVAILYWFFGTEIGSAARHRQQRVHDPRLWASTPTPPR